MDVNFAANAGKLPLELVEVLNQTYFLHLLATEPDLVIPPGKSLLSMMAHSRMKPQAVDPNSLLHDRVEQAIHSAFWNQALESLSDPTPSVQIDRLKGLYTDVREAISPLFPANHTILKTLSAPVPPTASPLISTTFLWKEILIALRQRAAPARDQVIDALLADLDAPLSPVTVPSTASSVKTSTNQLAQLIVNTTKSIVALADTLKADLNQFVLGSMTEQQLRSVVVQQAKIRETELILDVWGDSEKNGKARLKALWDDWVNTLEGPQEPESQSRERWIQRLVQALGSTTPVSCSMPDPVSKEERTPDGNTVGNQLPPQFFLTTPRLLYAQNYLQALVVAASLRSLTRLPPPTDGDANGPDFMQRIWTLLKAEIGEEDPYTGDTKIVNLADEVIRARGLVSAPDEIEEAQLRAAVDRTLQYGDPVFLLLQKRLLVALANRLCELRVNIPGTSNNTPERMQTGRIAEVERAGKRPRLMFDVEPDAKSTASKLELRAMPTVKGFEDTVVVRGIDDVVAKVCHHIQWVESVWANDGIV
ncbi:hypothetical protein B0H10DRAFT_2430347 [Mycena sp. CBHHK59/15]|nr:hypothetical protein B0H10DRAFT_2430347 [Mycena sp. CBHHK59/15]